MTHEQRSPGRPGHPIIGSEVRSSTGFELSGCYTKIFCRLGASAIEPSPEPLRYRLFTKRAGYLAIFRDFFGGQM